MRGGTTAAPDGIVTSMKALLPENIRPGAKPAYAAAGFEGETVPGTIRARLFY